jgi:protein-L-isoaspartate(D-aspartate) O-methyltransferase
MTLWMRRSPLVWPTFFLAAGLILGLPEHAPAQGRDSFREARERMVREFIQREGIANERVLLAMRTVPRHEFMPLAQRQFAYFDAALAIGHKQTISPPFIVAYMTEALDPQPTDVVLEIGTGSGYQAAILSNLVKEVYTIEIVDALAKSAEERLDKLGYKNIHVRAGDGYLGWPEHAPFDKIIVTCSPEDVPKPLVEQLKEGGKMIVPLGERYNQVFHLFEKRDGRLIAQKLINTLFVPMTGASEEQRNIQPDPLHPAIKNGGFGVDANQDGYPDDWHYQRQLVLDAEASDHPPSVRFTNTDPGRPAQALQGMAIDGVKLGSLQISLKYKLKDVGPGTAPLEKPSAMVHFYDDQRRVIAEPVLGGWFETDDWTTVRKTIPVPQKARELIFRIGLNGATGTLWVDDVSLTPLER